MEKIKHTLKLFCTGIDIIDEETFWKTVKFKIFKEVEHLGRKTFFIFKLVIVFSKILELKESKIYNAEFISFGNGRK